IGSGYNGFVKANSPLRTGAIFLTGIIALVAGCQNPSAVSSAGGNSASVTVGQGDSNAPKAPLVATPVPSAETPAAGATKTSPKPAKRFTYTPRPYPVDERGFSPVDKALAKAYAREDMVKEDEEG